jgi:hypothetical protein
MPNRKEQKPTILLADTETPHASEEVREDAYANLCALVALLVQIDERLALEEMEKRDAGRP